MRRCKKRYRLPPRSARSRVLSVTDFAIELCFWHEAGIERVSMQTSKKAWSLPHTYVILFAIIVVVATLTWLVPSGVFERQQLEIAEGYVTNTVVPGTFQPIDKVTDDGDLRQGLFDVLSAPAKGVVHAADVIAFVLVVGGAFGIIMKTGAIDRGMHGLANLLANK